MDVSKHMRYTSKKYVPNKALLFRIISGKNDKKWNKMKILFIYKKNKSQSALGLTSDGFAVAKRQPWSRLLAFHLVLSPVWISHSIGGHTGSFSSLYPTRLAMSGEPSSGRSGEKVLRRYGFLFWLLLCVHSSVHMYMLHSVDIISSQHVEEK